MMLLLIFFIRESLVPIEHLPELLNPIPVLRVLLVSCHPDWVMGHFDIELIPLFEIALYLSIGSDDSGAPAVRRKLSHSEEIYTLSLSFIQDGSTTGLKESESGQIGAIWMHFTSF